MNLARQIKRTLAMAAQAFGKYLFLWQVPFVLDGDPEKIGKVAHDAKVQVLIVKFVNGLFIYKPSGDPTWGYNLKPEHVKAWKKMGFKVWGYAYLYGVNPTEEAKLAANEALRLGLDGVAFDVEIEFETAQHVTLADGTPDIQFAEVIRPVSSFNTLKANFWSWIEGKPIPPQALIKSPFEAQADPAGNADIYMLTFKDIAKSIPTAFICFPLFRSPRTGGTWHNKLMYQTFMSHCDFGMPMTYWWGSTENDMKWMLRHSLNQWWEIAHKKPVIPIGRLYTSDGGTATAEVIAHFGQELHNYHLIGGGGWRFGTGLENSDWWEAFKNWPKWVIKPPNGRQHILELNDIMLHYLIFEMALELNLVDQDGYLLEPIPEDPPFPEP
jgi:hypothetical protein